MEKILVLDFGGQYNQLIARRVREQHVYAEIRPYNKITAREILDEGYKGVIFTGGPNSVYDERSPHYDSAVLDAGIPILGICYGCQLMAWMGGGEICAANAISEYGKTAFTHRNSALFEGVPEESVCWMSHTDYVKTVPAGFTVTASTANCPTAAMEDANRKLYAVQFHPEVTHTQYGREILKNFIYGVCGCKGDWHMDDFAQRSIAYYKEKIGDKKHTIQRSKGLGENEADMMWLTTMNPQTRRLIKIEPDYDPRAIADAFDLFLGDNLQGRKDFIAQNGHLYIDMADVS